MQEVPPGAKEGQTAGGPDLEASQLHGRAPLSSMSTELGAQVPSEHASAEAAFKCLQVAPFPSHALR